MSKPPPWVREDIRDIGPGTYGPLVIIDGELVTHRSPYKRATAPEIRRRTPW